MDLSSGLNSIHPRVWAVLIILVGAALVWRHYSEAGLPLITGGFALLSGRPEKDPNAGSIPVSPVPAQVSIQTEAEKPH